MSPISRRLMGAKNFSQGKFKTNKVGNHLGFKRPVFESRYLKKILIFKRGIHFVLQPGVTPTNLVFKALIMNDYQGAPFANWIKTGEKTIETRFRAFNYRGDIVICCGKTNSVGKNAGKALCIVELWKIRPMDREDQKAAGIPYNPKLKSFLLRNWRHFNHDFDFSPQRIAGAWQSLFDLVIPDDIEIIPRPDIKPFQEKKQNFSP